jgi:hypothetical protein
MQFASGEVLPVLAERNVRDFRRLLRVAVRLQRDAAIGQRVFHDGGCCLDAAGRSFEHRRAADSRNLLQPAG